MIRPPGVFPGRPTSGMSVVDKTPFFRHPLAFLANAEEWLNRALESVLEPQGYRVLAASTGRQLVDRAAAAGPDVILVNAHLPDLDGLQVCQALRQDPALARHTPIIIVTSTQSTKQQRLAALRVGAWDYLSLVPDAEELVLKLGTYTRAKLELARVLEESPVDQASGLYSSRGLERRARELAADAFRRHAALACVALGVEVAAAAAEPAALAAFDFVAALLHARGRTSDAIGRLNRSDFAVLAPATDAAGAVKLADRLSQAIETAPPRPEGLPPLRVRAGYEAVTDLHATPLPPSNLLEHASAALRQARVPGDGERIRGFQK